MNPASPDPPTDELARLRQRRWAPLLLALLGLALFFPRLSASGLWDPYEVRIADAARALVNAPSFTWGPQLGRPPLPVWLVAFGFKYLGIHELGGRLPIALLSLATLLAVYWAGVRLVGRRGALFGAFAFATTPAFLLGARQLTSDTPLLFGATLAVGGLARAAWPDEEESAGMRVVALLLGVAGLAIGQLSAGVLVGVLAPLAAVTLALALAGGAVGITLVGAIVTLCVIGRAIWEALGHSGYSSTLGGVAHPLAHTTTWMHHWKQLGFALFPWIAVAPVAVIHFFGDRSSEEPAIPSPKSADRFGGLLLITWIVCEWIAGTVQSAGVQDLHVPAGPALLLLVGGYLDQLLDEERPLPFAGLAIAIGAIVLGRDFFLQPEQYVGVHILEAVRWPGPLTHVPYVLMAFAAFFGGVLGLGLGAPLASSGQTAATPRWRGRKTLLTAAGASALAMSLTTAYFIVPQVSKHLSAREIYGKTRTLDPNAPVGQYRFNASGSSYYSGDKAPVQLSTLVELFQFLAHPERVFVMAGAEELPAIDQQSRQSRQPYVVADDSNSRYLVLSNRLGPNEQDLNPLKRFISETAPTPAHPLVADFEGKVQLIGYDLPDQLGRGQDFKIRLYFKVLAPVGGAYKVFLHFDGPGTRFNGDHVPLESRFPTTNWVPGFYITDEHAMTPDRATQPEGIYHLFMGFFAGENRLKVTSGPQDGENRVRLGSVNIR